MAKTAEIIAIGDELVSGQILDTNTQWLSLRLSELGVETRFHSCVGDSMGDGISVFRAAIERADIVLTTGGLGPTNDDLTRQVIADVANVELVYQADIEEHIKTLFARFGRKMPANNKIQAYFPNGSKVIPNAEGTAPGIDLMIENCRVFALPGVPYEMYKMWDDHVRSDVIAMSTDAKTIKHHVVHCFGEGESQIEERLGDLTDRASLPRVGITASDATISLRITAVGVCEQDCLNQMIPVIAAIQQRLGDLVFGENGVELQDVVLKKLASLDRSIALIDYGFGGAASQALQSRDSSGSVHKGTIVASYDQLDRWLGQPTGEEKILLAARKVRVEFGADVGVAISPPDENLEGSRICNYEIAFADSDSVVKYRLDYAGHSGLRHARTMKQILNKIRLHLSLQSDQP